MPKKYYQKRPTPTHQHTGIHCSWVNRFGVRCDKEAVGRKFCRYHFKRAGNSQFEECNSQATEVRVTRK